MARHGSLWHSVSSTRRIGGWSASMSRRSRMLSTSAAPVGAAPISTSRRSRAMNRRAGSPCCRAFRAESAASPGSAPARIAAAAGRPRSGGAMDEEEEREEGRARGPHSRGRSTRATKGLRTVSRHATSGDSKGILHPYGAAQSTTTLAAEHPERSRRGAAEARCRAIVRGPSTAPARSGGSRPLPGRTGESYRLPLGSRRGSGGIGGASVVAVRPMAGAPAGALRRWIRCGRMPDRAPWRRCRGR